MYVPRVIAAVYLLTLLWAGWSIGLCERRGYCGLGASWRFISDSLTRR